MHSETEPPLEGPQPEGRYANQFKVGHNFFEFVIDFGQSYGEDGAVKYHTRMVTNPVYAKSLLKLLAESGLAPALRFLHLPPPPCLFIHLARSLEGVTVAVTVPA